LKKSKKNQILKSELEDLKTKHQKLIDDILDINHKANTYSESVKNQEEKLNGLQNLASDIASTKKKIVALIEENNSLKQELNTAQLNLYSFQLSPHFIKNYITKTFLNYEDENVFNKIRKTSILGYSIFKSTELEEVIKNKNISLNESLNLLVQVLNYLLYSQKNQLIQLKTELIELAHFFKLLELNNNVRFIFTNHVKDDSINIPPTALFFFIENAVKHGYFKNSNEIFVILNKHQNYLYYQVTNPIFPNKPQKSMDVGGLGNTLIKQQNLNYHFEMTDQIFTATLKIKI